MLDFSTLALKNAERCEKGFNHKIDSWSIADWGLAIGGELGEMFNYCKKLKRFDDGIQPPKDQHLTREEIIENIGKEMADVVIYLDLFATRMNMRLGYEVIKKFNETSAEINSPIVLHQN